MTITSMKPIIDMHSNGLVQENFQAFMIAFAGLGMALQ